MTPPQSGGGGARARRAEIVGREGATVWITGLPAAGKTTLARALEERLLDAGVLARWLDGDDLREGVSSDLGFDPASRSEQSRRVAWIAAMLTDLGAVTIVSLISPYAADRRAARQRHEQEGLRFVEVFIDTPLEECMARDPRRLYARALAGELTQVTGIDAPYEAPEDPELWLRSGAVEANVDRLLDLVVHQ